MKFWIYSFKLINIKIFKIKNTILVIFFFEYFCDKLNNDYLRELSLYKTFLKTMNPPKHGKRLYQDVINDSIML